MDVEIGGRSLTPAARRIADAAVDVAAERGYEGLSVRSVAHQAGVSAGAVQHHFPTRADLLAAAFLRTAERIAARVAWRPDDAASTRAWLLRLGEELLPLDDTRRRECVVWVVLSAAAATDDRLAALHRQAVQLMTDAVAEALGRGTTVGAPRMAAAVSAVLDGLGLHCLTGARTPDEARALLAATVDTVLPC